MIPTDVATRLSALEPALPPGALDAFDRYLDLLLAANKELNLTSVRDKQDAWSRHVLDSLELHTHLRGCAAGARVLDVGSGGGLPGIPLAIARPDLRFTLLEATAKKATRLRHFAADLALTHVEVVCERAETLAQRPARRAAYDVVVTRALAKLPTQLELTLPFLRVHGVLLAMKGRSVDAEIPQAARALRLLGGGAIVTSATSGGWILRIEKEQATPRRYPRLPGQPGKVPL